MGQWGPWMCLLTGCLLVERPGLSQKTPSHCSDEEECTEHNSGSNFLHVSTHPSRPFPISGSFPPPGLLHTLLPLRLRFRILVTSALIFHLQHPQPWHPGWEGYTSACPPFRCLRHFWKGTHDSRLFPQDILGLQEKYDHTPAGITRGLLFPVKSITLQLSLWKQLHFKKLQMQL